jgi:two-component system response regulator AtoC
MLRKWKENMKPESHDPQTQESGPSLLKALVVEDEDSTLRYVAKLVEQEGFATRTARTFKEALAELQNQQPDILLVDLKLPDGNGLDLVKDLESRSNVEVVVITAHASIDSVIEALQLRAADYLPKPIDTQRLKTILKNIVRIRGLTLEIDDLRTKLRTLGHFDCFLGNSPPMQKVYDLITRVAPTDATVLVTGESGTGKELVAQTLHNLSRRRKEAFLALNCGAVSPTLIESELFGHEAGSFTGASKLHRGYFERADRGTLFLDEITEMPIELQVKLLRVLETGRFLRVGGDKEIQAEVRLLAASNRDPLDAVADGKLREDLYYRLNVFSIAMPPLIERGDDIDILACHFLAELNRREGTSKRLSKEALKRFRSYAWPGNVRELKNVVERAFILADDEIVPDFLPATVQAKEEPDPESPLHFRLGTPLAEIERRTILYTLERCQGNKKKTAEVLGINLRTLYNRLSAYKAEDEASGREKKNGAVTRFTVQG